MKKYLLIILTLSLPATINAQQQESSASPGDSVSQIKKSEKMIIATVQEAITVCKLEQCITRAGAMFDQNKISYKGPIYIIPIPATNGAKVLFWYRNPAPKICATTFVNLEEDTEPSMFYIERDPTPEEEKLCWWMKVAADEIRQDSLYATLPYTHLTVIPYQTSFGGVVFLFQRAMDLTTCIFGQERIFVYNNKDSLIGRGRVHDQPGKSCIAEFDASAPKDRIVHHFHEFHNLDDFPISDLITAFRYEAIHRIRKFVILATAVVFTFDFETGDIGLYTRKEYEQDNPIPQKPQQGWQL